MHGSRGRPDKIYPTHQPEPELFGMCLGSLGSYHIQIDLNIFFI